MNVYVCCPQHICCCTCPVSSDPHTSSPLPLPSIAVTLPTVEDAPSAVRHQFRTEERHRQLGPSQLLSTPRHRSPLTAGCSAAGLGGEERVPPLLSQGPYDVHGAHTLNSGRVQHPRAYTYRERQPHLEVGAPGIRVTPRGERQRVQEAIHNSGCIPMAPAPHNVVPAGPRTKYNPAQQQSLWKVSVRCSPPPCACRAGVCLSVQ